MTDILALTAADYLAHFRRRTLSPVEVTRACLDGIGRWNGIVNAFIVVDEAGAMAAARASEARWGAGTPLALDGVPVTIKDNIAVTGLPNRRGSKVSDPAPMTYDAPSVARLKEAGAVILGKTTMPEFGWKGVGDSPLTGITRNPWNIATNPGGSSSGAAAGGARSGAARSISAPTGRARSGFPQVSQAFTASSNRSAGCRPIRPHPSPCSPMSGR